MLRLNEGIYAYTMKIISGLLWRARDSGSARNDTIMIMMRMNMMMIILMRKWALHKSLPWRSKVFSNIEVCLERFDDDNNASLPASTAAAAAVIVTVMFYITSIVSDVNGSRVLKRAIQHAIAWCSLRSLCLYPCQASPCCVPSLNCNVVCAYSFLAAHCDRYTITFTSIKRRRGILFIFSLS